MAYESTTHTAESLLYQYQQSGDLALRDKVIAMHLHIADIVARRFSGRGVEYDDLYQVSSLALVKAIERFDLHKGVKFVSYATPTMVGEVKNYFRDKSRLISMPRRHAALRTRMQKARAELEQQLMRVPTPMELAQALEMPLEDVLEALESQGAVSPLSLDASPTGADDSPFGALLGRAEEGFERFDDRDLVRRALTQLEADEQIVIRRRYFEGLSQRVVGEGMGVSQMAISRIERRALGKIRVYVTSAGTEEDA